MKLPTSIDIKGVKYQVKHKWNLTDDNGNPCHGLTDREKKIIWVDRFVKGELKKSTFLHELMHGLFKEMKASGTILTEDTEEMIVQNIEEFLMSKWNMRLKK
jgi:hypothetical protein